jgi:hypothetical protein
MSHPHKFLRLHNIKAGMVLSDDLLDKLGHILLPAGTILTESMINSMPHHDIHHLPILLKDAVASEENILIERQKKTRASEKNIQASARHTPRQHLIGLCRKIPFGS